MAVQVEQLGRAFSAETEHQFTVWTLATPDPLEQVLEPGYFGRCYSRFRLGDLVVCATRQPPGKPQEPRDAHPDRHRCLLMVTRLVPGGVEVRVAQDWGSPAEGPRAARPAEAAARRRLGLADWAGLVRRRTPARRIRRGAAG